jgi:DNA-binding CsgD family transcriptional regulator
MPDGPHALTEKEKETLRLILRGYDAKSSARHLGLSVHTVNERLRLARRKLAVSSSREAARLLNDSEAQHPDFLGYRLLGEAMAPAPAQPSAPPGRMSRAWIAGGLIAMSLLLAVLALAALPQTEAPPAPTTDAPTAAASAEVVQSARNWLALVDASRWAESWAATGQAFRKLNTEARWSSLSDKVRVPLGAATSRVLTAEESVPAPPAGVEMVKFRTSFANKPAATETLSLVRESGAWKVVGYWIG